MKIQNGKTLIKWQKSIAQTLKLMDNNCHFHDLVQAFSFVKNGELNLVL